jgi:ketosteroid isomerase-like protein
VSGQAQEVLAIQELTHRYAWYVDSRCLDQLMTLWADDAVFDASADGASPVCEGAEAVRRYFAGVNDSVASLTHHLTTQMVVVDGETASGICYFQASAAMDDGTRQGGEGRYEDRYVRRDGRWLFSYRRMIPFV